MDVLKAVSYTHLHPEDEKIIRNYKIKDRANRKIALLLKNYKLSDDIAFRFSDVNWKEHPLSVEKFVDWVESLSLIHI